VKLSTPKHRNTQLVCQQIVQKNIVAVCNCLITEDSCRPPFKIHERKDVFAYFLLHVCLLIILDGARNIQSLVNNYDNTTKR